MNAPNFKHRPIAENVSAFLSKAATDYGRMQAERFSQYRYTELLERGLESPIEDLFYIALHVMCESQSIPVNPSHIGPGDWPFGVYVDAQIYIGKYRVDFLLYDRNDQLSPVIVELDGHDFHDKDKRQRSYEKARDRFFTKKKFRFLHFTGSDVVADPYGVAFEALDLLGIFYEGHVYDPSNPFGID